MELFNVIACVITAITYLLLSLFNRSNLAFAYDKSNDFIVGDERIDFLQTKRVDLQILYTASAPLFLIVYMQVIDSSDTIWAIENSLAQTFFLTVLMILYLLQVVITLGFYFFRIASSRRTATINNLRLKA